MLYWTKQFEKEYHSTEEVAKLLNISKRQVSRLVKRGELVREKKKGIPSWSVYWLLKRGYEEIYCERFSKSKNVDLPTP